MGRFRKQPVVIEAAQYLGRNTYGEMTPWLSQAIGDGVVRFTPDATLPDLGQLTIATLEGTHIASPGDWIIRGVKGEVYPCKPDIFESTYEAVRDA